MEVEISNLVTISCADHSQYVAMALRNLFYSKRGTDFDLRLGNKSVRAHRLILELFLAPEFTGTIQDECPTIKQEVPDDGNGSGRNILNLLVEFLYNGEVDVPEQQLEELLKVAEELDFKLLIDAVQACRPVDIVTEEKLNFDMDCDLYSSDIVNGFEGLEGTRTEDVKYTHDTFDNSKSLQPNVNARPCFVNLGPRIPVPYQRTRAGSMDGKNSGDLYEISNLKRLEVHPKYIKFESDIDSVDSPSRLEDIPEVSNSKRLPSNNSLDLVLPNGVNEGEDDCGATRDNLLYPGTSINPYKKNTGMFKCPHCDIETPTYKGHENHLSQVHGLTAKETPAPMRKCANCEFQTSSGYHYRRHCLSVHQLTVRGEPVRQYKCPNCEYSTAWPKSLNQHLATMHNQEISNACPQCSYVGSLKIHLEQHMFIAHGVGVSRFTCKVCGKHCISPSKLQAHYRSHFNDRPFICPHCNYAATDVSNLRKHMNSIHGEGHSRFICDVCQNRFTSRAYLEMHARTHTIDRPFKCTLCSYAAIQSLKLQNHMWVTHGEGDSGVTCEVCRKRCSSSAALDCHMRMHSNERQFKCPHCTFASNHSGSLGRHVRLVHCMEM